MRNFKIPGRRTRSGAYTETKVFDSSGKELIPLREYSRSESHWEDTFSLNDGIYLVLTEDYSNSRKDNSYAETEGKGELSVFQQELKKKFEEKHGRENE